jgi:hypothetical protein
VHSLAVLQPAALRVAEADEGLAAPDAVLEQGDSQLVETLLDAVRTAHARQAPEATAVAALRVIA